MATIFDTNAVCIERPPEIGLGNFFAAMRSWLDHQSIEPLEFKRIAPRGFELRFKSFREATLFDQRFGDQEEHHAD